MNRLSKPAIGKSEHTLIGRQDIHQTGPNDPTTDRRVGTTIMAETRLLKLTFQCVVVSERQDFDDHIDVLSCTNWSGGNIGHQNSGRTTTNKHKSLAQWAEGRRDELKYRQIRIHWIHAIRSVKIRAASCRSRAAPPRNASNNARNSYSTPSFRAAYGAVG